MSMAPVIQIGHRKIGSGEPCFIIAEAGVNHNGRVELALRLVDAARGGKVESNSNGALIVACELILEGLHSQKKIARNEEKGKTSYNQATPERGSRRQQQFDDWSGGRVN